MLSSLIALFFLAAILFAGSPLLAMAQQTGADGITVEGGGTTGGNSSIAGGGTDTNTTTGMADGNNSILFYENPQYGIHIHYPQDWRYLEETETAFPFEFSVAFLSPADFQGILRAPLSGLAPKVPPTVSVATGELPSGITDLQQFANLFIANLTSEGHQIISINYNASLSGMPAFEAVFVEPENMIERLYIWTIQGDRAYAVGYASDESRFEQSLPIAQQMISSFAITNGNTTGTPLIGDNYGNTTTNATAPNIPGT